ncbi:hypothetical protein PTSG_11600 [Salpingoeca rosetta]|uniref:CCHC-type domain-containing protein n=1 Tax=Salpingoeca rosetta (strain ATCC 50818 / BSB-021) TaxID=946362 RepID=F2TWQ9_SALR5|nr:uncharacterized protein PTSG_11600 [Salpingoeca rosetta]EGD72505.1 hypothetical protein PTSG_11600 [Salpingoeca rosetta]|eukprot:XP_004999074.1 hypothetical protein PTSG_11600 [Salpingoeca rosetta]
MSGRRTQRCRCCGNPGHNARTCPLVRRRATPREAPRDPSCGHGDGEPPRQRARTTHPQPQQRQQQPQQPQQQQQLGNRAPSCGNGDGEPPRQRARTTHPQPQQRQQQQQQPPSRAGRTRERRCGRCGQTGHTVTTCSLSANRMDDVHLLPPLTRECPYCGALLFDGQRREDGSETSSFCCGNGRVHLEPMPAPPAPLRQLWEDRGERGRIFYDYIRLFNNALALASARASWVRAERGWSPHLIIQGSLHHCIGSLLPAEGEEPQFAQVYVYDNVGQATARRLLDMRQRIAAGTSVPDSICANILTTLHDMLVDCNPYVDAFRDAASAALASSGDDAVPDLQLVLNSENRPADQHARRYTSGNSEEVALLCPDDQVAQRDLVVYPRDGGIQFINETHQAWDPLHFVLLFPDGTPGWRIGVPLRVPPSLGGDQRRPDQCGGAVVDAEDVMGLGGDGSAARHVSTRQFYVYHLMQRSQCNYLLRAGRLTQEYICSAFYRVEYLRLLYVRQHQAELRSAIYQNLVDHSGEDDADEQQLGRRVVASLAAVFAANGITTDTLTYDGPWHIPADDQERLALLAGVDTYNLIASIALQHAPNAFPRLTVGE